MKKLSTIFFACSLLVCTTAMSQKKERAVWSKEKANAWYAKLPWMVGADYIPASAINQLEMWQAESFDSAQIDKELGWAEGIGMNVMRVYLHHLAWQVDPAGFKKRVNTYLNIAGKHGIKTVFVLFDDCWNNTYKAGKQPAPKTGVHNSGWVQDPGMLSFMDLNYMNSLEKYVKDVLQAFRNDNRILLWDVYNEPGNSGLRNHSMPLLKNTFSWGRQVDPSQPLSAGVWSLDLKELNAFQLQQSDVITYHNYHKPDVHQRWIDSFLVQTGKPLICTEYMARTRGSLFHEILPILKKHKIAAINWGLVAGKSNTIYAWDTPMPEGGEPKVWFHDIFRPDGTPYDPRETAFIKEITGKK